jgi:membrane protease YdiL (CAAX protease family)
VIQSGLSGLVLSVIYVLTGSLWIPIALHIVGDTYSGTLGWLAFGENG